MYIGALSQSISCIPSSMNIFLYRNNGRPLPLHHRHIAGASVQLQKAAKLLDSGAVRATRFLWRYPIARIILLFYLVFVHLFLMYLLHRLQEQADNFAAREVAESMGLTTSNLP